MSNLAPPITSDNAREMSAKAWAKRNARQAELESAEKELQALKAKLSEISPDTDRAKRMAKQMDLVEIQMRKCEDSKDLANLSAAHARLFSAWCVLTGTKSPGTLGKTRRERPSAPQPIPLETPATPPAPPANEDWKQFTG